MKKVSRCIECGRAAYTNDDQYCKRCYREAMVSGKVNVELPEEPEGSMVIEDE
jgi:hypothetical protein